MTNSPSRQRRTAISCCAALPIELSGCFKRSGARQAEMRGKPMSAGWIRVDADAVREDGVLQQWIDVAVAHAESRSS